VRESVGDYSIAAGRSLAARLRLRWVLLWRLVTGAILCGTGFSGTGLERLFVMSLTTPTMRCSEPGSGTSSVIPTVSVSQGRWALGRTMLDSLHIPLSSNGAATLTGSWRRPRYWDWNGTISASEPIVALCFLQVGTRLEWARSEKGSKTSLDVRLLLGFDAPDKANVCVSFSIGENQTRQWTLLDDADKPPQPPERCSVPIGRVFPFCPPFGSPRILLFGLVLLRGQAIGARNGIWHLKPEYCARLSDTWTHILSYGRSGFITLEHEAA
jgi:hypothetical protein